MVKSSPAVKFLLRNAYQMAFDLLPRPKDWSVRPLSYREQSFFGFHDCSPFSLDDTKVLSYRTHIPVRMPKADETLEVGYYDLTSDGVLGDFHPLATTLTWNYHKGCRLQWMGQDKVIFNAGQGDAPAYAVCDVATGETIVHSGAFIDTLSPDGKVATSFSYERLNVLMPGYGYEYCKDAGALDEKAPSTTGLSLVDIELGTSTMLLSLKTLADEVDAEHAYSHYVTHSEFSPDGKYISFLHRWIGDDYRKRNTRMIIYNRETKQYVSLPTTGMVSHYIWNQRNEIVAYCSVEGLAGGHVRFRISDLSYTPIKPDTLNDDGHQSMLGNTKFVTDKYPDRRRMASLSLVDMETQEVTPLARVYSPKKFQTKDFHKHIACDLHPRVSPSGRFVSFDTAFSGQRSLCVMRLPE